MWKSAAHIGNMSYNTKFEDTLNAFGCLVVAPHRYLCPATCLYDGLQAHKLQCYPSHIFPHSVCQQQQRFETLHAICDHCPVSSPMVNRYRSNCSSAVEGMHSEPLRIPHNDLGLGAAVHST
ncbi:hypothetical protein CRM22_002436 [Opisthorchis felineus]|uniref:Uncharacterized protein n=1 Tax=Opisthorchis felineus TaxID=147828 RepID=A0A4S2M6I5_OPIFE|nr:hypothetical protein CRM22_002436 [Opisthorchis felineus]